jgi:hypothetical protein
MIININYHAMRRLRSGGNKKGGWNPAALEK